MPRLLKFFITLFVLMLSVGFSYAKSAINFRYVDNSKQEQVSAKQLKAGELKKLEAKTKPFNQSTTLPTNLKSTKKSNFYLGAGVSYNNNAYKFSKTELFTEEAIKPVDPKPEKPETKPDLTVSNALVTENGELTFNLLTEKDDTRNGSLSFNEKGELVLTIGTNVIEINQDFKSTNIEELSVMQSTQGQITISSSNHSESIQISITDPQSNISKDTTTNNTAEFYKQVTIAGKDTTGINSSTSMTVESINKTESKLENFNSNKKETVDTNVLTITQDQNIVSIIKKQKYKISEKQVENIAIFSNDNTDTKPHTIQSIVEENGTTTTTQAKRDGNNIIGTITIEAGDTRKIQTFEANQTGGLSAFSLNEVGGETDTLLLTITVTKNLDGKTSSTVIYDYKKKTQTKIIKDQD